MTQRLNKLKFKTKPYQHQINAVESTLSSFQSATFKALFMEVGTGKTKTAIDIFVNSDCQRLVVICPKTLFRTWEEELVIHSDLKSGRYKKQRLLEEVMLINVEAFQASTKEPEKAVLAFIKGYMSLVVMDESVKIKTPNAMRTKRCIAMADKFKYRIIMTGTEVSSGILSLYSQFQFLSKTFWWDKAAIASFKAFQNRFSIMKNIIGPNGRFISIPKRTDELNSREVTKHQAMIEAVNRIISPYVFRVRREDCLDLPEKIEEVIHVTLNAEESRVYKSMREDLIVMLQDESVEAVNAIAQFVKLRQITSGSLNGQMLSKVPSKLHALLEDLEGISEQVIIVAYFRSDVDLIAESLGAVKMHGGQSDKENEWAMKCFKDESKYLIAQHDMMAQGFNLQFCHLMYIYSSSLIAETNAQFMGRIDRNGQIKRPVFKWLVSDDTVDEKIHALLKSRGDVQSYFSNLSRHEALNLVDKV